MEISALEIEILCRRVQNLIGGYHLSGIYSMEEGILLRLNHETKAELMIAISSFATWITSKNLSLPQSSFFVLKMREIIERDKLVNVEQVSGERVARFVFENRKNECHALYTEFFGGGNRILTERRRESDIIIAVSKSQRFRHRTLAQGETYLLPPARGLPLTRISAKTLGDLLRESRKVEKEKLTAIQWFGRNVGTSRKFVEEIFSRSNVRPEKLAYDLDIDEIDKLVEAALQLIAELETSYSGFLLQSSSIETGKSIPEDTMKSPDSDEIIVDVCPIIPKAWTILLDKGIAKVQRFQSLSDALDEAQTQALVLERREKASKETRSKILELDSAIRKQKELIAKNWTTSNNLRSIARILMMEEDRGISPALISQLASLGVLQDAERKNGEFQFISEPRSLISSFNSRSLASRLFDEAKKLGETNRKLIKVRETLEGRIQDLRKQTAITEERVEKRTSVERRPREWFERYRWFFTSDGRLVVGGRDSTSNSIVINKYTEPRDVVFHADLHGSPFFVLKNSMYGEGDGEVRSEIINENIALEVAQATVSFSRAWKDELGSADAFWIFPEQVKKSAPSGEYLPRGSFFIEGKKNIVKHVKVELAVAIIKKDLLARHNSTHIGDADGIYPTSARIQDHQEQVVVVCAPEKSVTQNSLSYVKITFGKEKGSLIAKKIKQQLIGKIKDTRLKEIAMKFPTDDIIRVLPSGLYKIISEKQKC